jgi:hypothetical protein
MTMTMAIGATRRSRPRFQHRRETLASDDPLRLARFWMNGRNPRLAAAAD